jgi:hypothetical protein
LKYCLAVLILVAQARADSRLCAGCHAQQVRAYLHSAMAHSLASAGTLPPQPEGSFVHSFSKTKFTAGATTQQLERAGTAQSATVAYVIGSGSHAFGYLMQVGNHLFQSPLSYYTQRKQWDMAPGYEEDPQPDFTRPVSTGCLLCHAGQPQPLPDTLNQFQSPPFVKDSLLGEAISCERCHGPSAAHVRNPVAGSILNPAKLQGAVRDSVCEQCHLTGEIRIPNPGRAFADFQPGARLEQVYSIYVKRQNQTQTVKVVSHAEQLALSRCARSSAGKLWCGTCHSPHANAPQTAATYRERCLTCHATSLSTEHAAVGRDCVSCHMPKLPARDGGHTAFTDHRIARRPNPTEAPAEAPAKEREAPGDLTAWREPEQSLRDRNLALALVSDGIQNGASEEVIRGYKMLNKVERDFPNDPLLLSTLGSILLKAKQPAEALRRFQQVILLRPAYAPYQVSTAAALVALGRTAEGRQHLEKALQLDPLLGSALALRDRLAESIPVPQP